MQAAPAFQVTLERFGIARTLVVAVALVTSAGLGLWCYQVAAEHPVLALVFRGLGLGLTVGLLASLWKIRTFSLRWDSQRWHLGPASTRGNEPRAGELQVCWDAGGLMLLRFRPDQPMHPGWFPLGRAGTDVWLPVQKSGHAAHWHALRCTLYCARPRTTPPSPGEP